MFAACGPPSGQLSSGCSCGDANCTSQQQSLFWGIQQLLGPKEVQLTPVVDLQAKKTGTGTPGPVTVKQVKKQDVATADDKEEITAEDEVSNAA